MISWFGLKRGIVITALLRVHWLLEGRGWAGELEHEPLEGLGQVLVLDEGEEDDGGEDDGRSEDGVPVGNNVKHGHLQV